MKRLIALSCFAAMLLAGCGETGKKDSSEKTTEAITAASESSAEADTAEAYITTEAVTATAADEENTESENSDPEPDGMVSAGGRMDMYPAVYQGEIQRVFYETSDKNNGMASIEYAFRDLDADGIPELILKYGTCEADYQIHIYRYDEECELNDLGVFGGGHTSFAYDENTGDFVIVWGHMGSASIQYYVWEDGTLKSRDHYDFTIDEQTPSYDTVLDEKSVRYIDYVSASKFAPDGSITSFFFHPNGDYEKMDGLYLDYMG